MTTFVSDVTVLCDLGSDQIIATTGTILYSATFANGTASPVTVSGKGRENQPIFGVRIPANDTKSLDNTPFYLDDGLILYASTASTGITAFVVKGQNE